MVATAKKPKKSPRTKARTGRGLKAVSGAKSTLFDGSDEAGGSAPTTKANGDASAGGDLNGVAARAQAMQADDSTPSAGAVVKLGKKRLTVEFGGMSAGDGTASIGVRISRTLLTLAEADDLFCDRQLTGEIKTLPGQDAAGQQHITDGDKPIVETHEIKGTFDVSRFGVSRKFVTAKLRFNIVSIDPGELARFSKQPGQMLINGAKVLEGKKRGRPAGAKGAKTKAKGKKGRKRKDAASDPLDRL